MCLNCQGNIFYEYVDEAYNFSCRMIMFVYNETCNTVFPFSLITSFVLDFNEEFQWQIAQITTFIDMHRASNA